MNNQYYSMLIIKLSGMNLQFLHVFETLIVTSTGLS